MKKELGDLEAEVFVLAHTEELLSGQGSAIQDAVKKIERKQGISVRCYKHFRSSTCGRFPPLPSKAGDWTESTLA